MPEEKTPGENAEEKTPVESGENEKDSTETPGKGETADYLEIEGMGKVTAEDIKALKAAQVGLEKDNKSKKDRLSELEKKLEEIENKSLSEEERFRKEIEAERKALLSDKVALELEKAGVSVDPSALNLGVEKLSEVSSAVSEFVDKYPGLVSKKETVREETKNPAPSGGSPGEPPPNTDKEKEWIQRLKAAEAKGDIQELERIKAEIAAHRGTETKGKGAAL